MSKKNICQILTPRISSRFIGKVTVPSGGLVAGNIVLADTLDNTIFGNIEVFTAKKPISANMGKTFFALVINDGFETLADGRRPQGDPNYFDYSYQEGDVAPVIFLGDHLIFNIGLNAIESSTLNLALVGNFLVPTNNSYKLSAVEGVPDNVNCALKILAFHSTPIGGEFSGKFETTLICTPIVDDVIDTGARMLSFSLPNQIGSSVINSDDGTITAVVAGSRTSMAATFQSSTDSTVTVGGVTQVSGVTTNNFTSDVTYTVTSESGNSIDYVVTVSLETYDLSITEDDYVSISVLRNGSSVEAGSDVLSYGDSITITATPASGASLTSLTVNGEPFVSGSTYTVVGNVSIVATSELIPYTLTLNVVGGVSFVVQRDGVTLDGTQPIYKGDVLVLNGDGGIEVTIQCEGQDTITLNNPTNYEYTVIADTEISAHSVE